ncbi:unnamed protein product [Echinostoma caproni]|uniref:CCDC92 domain-containing protein n=1 Tax=Echinostoma caproni TaxID=27848 RepID=A0A183A6K2_9TREM|nr:unnamed protein product [Echinostoma caproni]
METTDKKPVAEKPDLSVSAVQTTQELNTANGDETIENLRVHLRELEKRCALQQLRHEEVLLELEDARKRSRQDSNLIPALSVNLDSTYTPARASALEFGSHYSTPTGGVVASSSSVIAAPTATATNVLVSRPTLTDLNLTEGRLGAPTHELTSQLSLNQSIQGARVRGHIKGRLFAGAPVLPDEQDPNLVELFQTADGPFETNGTCS